MPLLKPILNQEFTKILDSQSTNFVGFPQNTIEVANNWANVIDTYAKSVTPISTTFAIAKQLFFNTMLGIDANVGNGLVVLQNAFVAYASQLALGMTGAGFVGTPPPTPIDFSTIVPIGLAGATGATIANLFSDITDTWFRTGTATNIISGIVTNWL